MNQLLVKAENDRIAVPSDWMQRKVCDIHTPHGLVPYTVEEAEQKYIKDFPQWDSIKINFPPGPSYSDKMANKTPTTRARDLEEKYKGKQ